MVNIDWLLDAWIVNNGRPIRNTAKYEYAQRKFRHSTRTSKTDKKADQKIALPQPPRMLSLEDTGKSFILHSPSFLLIIVSKTTTEQASPEGGSTGV